MRPSTQLFWHSIVLMIIGLAIWLMGTQIHNLRIIVHDIQMQLEVTNNDKN